MPSASEQTDDARARSEIERFLKNYGEPDTRQPSEEAETDPQLKSMMLTIANELSGSSAGTVIDIGCGEGVLLRRLAGLAAFQDLSDWNYLGIDFPEQTEKVLHLAVSLKLHRRVEALTLDSFYAEGIEKLKLPNPRLVIVRNVFHELDISATSQLLSHITTIIAAGQKLLVQDLQVFPLAERGNVCWIPRLFCDLIEECDFKCTFTEEPSKSGNRWFTMVAHRTESATTLPPERLLPLVIKHRSEQFRQWTLGNAIVEGDDKLRTIKLALLDFDLQKAALQNQLSRIASTGVETPTADEQGRLAVELFSKHLALYSVDALQKSIVPVDRPAHFRDRAHSQDDLEDFLRGPQRTVLITGGPQIGKTDLVAEVLARRAHDRQAVIVDVQNTSSVWNLIEQWLAGIGCTFPYDLLSTYRDLHYESLDSQFRLFVGRIARHTIVVFDHFERLLDPSDNVSDTEIIRFLEMLSSHSDAKIIITTRRLPTLDFLVAETVDLQQKRIGRLPGNEHIENILDDFVNRSHLGLESYPAALFDAIDRLPYLAVLAGKIIAKEGDASLKDNDLLALLRDRLRDELLRRILTERAKPAIDVLRLLRIPVPRSIFEELAGQDAVDEAEEIGLLYPAFDFLRKDMITGPPLLRRAFDTSDDGVESTEHGAEVEAANGQHRAIARCYERLYRERNDPRWVRELHYHLLAAGDRQEIARFGSAYRDELFWAGNFWFRVRKDYTAALEAFQAAESLGLITYASQLKLAACLMRLGHNSDGESRYEALIKQYPLARGVKTSYIDSLLYRRNFLQALESLERLGLNLNDGPWIAHEYGRAFTGLYRYADAVKAFEIQRHIEPSALAFYSLAQAYHAAGQKEDVGRILNAANKRFRHNFKLALAYVTHLVREGDRESLLKAEEILSDIRAERPFDGGAIQQHVKLLCLTGRSAMAADLVREEADHAQPEYYITPIRVELLCGQQRWSAAVSELRNISSTDKYLIGLKKRVFLEWALSEADAQRIAVARQGMGIATNPELLHNISILVASSRLAKIAGEVAEYEELCSRLADINPKIAEMVRQGDSQLKYWEDTSFDR